MNSFSFLNYHGSVHRRESSIHKIRVFIPEVTYGTRNGLGWFYPGGGGTPHNDLYGEAPRERGIFLGVRYKNG